MAKIEHTPQCIARKAKGLGGCWCRLIAAKKSGKAQ